jgi:hypothetical protein
MRRALLAVALTAALVNPVHSSLLDPLWSFLVALWEAPATADSGCSMDPYGSCQPQPDDGCSWDPYGRCQPGS